MNDPYIDSQSGILRNKFGLTDHAALHREEAKAYAFRSTLLRMNPLNGNFDCEHLKAIHFYLFRDVYDWAGQYRTVPLAKAEFVSGGRITRFTPPELIKAELSKLFSQLAKEQSGFLKDILCGAYCSAGKEDWRVFSIWYFMATSWLVKSRLPQWH